MADPNEYRALIEPLARHFFGEPTSRSATELRFGSRGSMSIRCDLGTWYDHEQSKGGGALDLVTYKTGLEGSERFGYLDRIGLRLNGGEPQQRKRQVVATYDYRDEADALLFQVVKYDPKDFKQRRPDPHNQGEWMWSVKGIRQVPYRLRELMAAVAAKKMVFVAEGEKDCDNLVKAGAIATTNAGGVGKWRNEFCGFFSGADVVVIADNDPQATDKDDELMWHEDGRPVYSGFDHAHGVAAKLQPYVRSLKVVDLGRVWTECPSKGDISNYFEKGATLVDLELLVAATAAWEPSQALCRQGDPPSAPAPVEPTALPEPWKRPGFLLSDRCLAEAFLSRYAEDFLYSAVRKVWRRWDDARWRDDEVMRLEDRLADFLRENIEPTLKKVKDRLRIGATASVGQIERRLRFTLALDEGTLDANPRLLNCPSATRDLGECVDRPHERRDLITKMTKVDPAPAVGSLWLNFVEFITNGDKHLANYLQCLCGSALEAGANEQIVAFLWGSGNNGKSVFLQALLWTLGDYAVTLPADTFIWTNFPRKPDELMPMRGSRLVVASEVPPDAKWDEARLKTVSGGERIRARNLWENSVEFDPPGLLIMAGNDKPGLTNIGEAIRRRFRVVPFTATVPAEMRDIHLLDKLKLEAGGILQWMLTGHRQWKLYGLGYAEAVEGATEQYIQDEDSIRQWIEDCCSTNDDDEATINALYKSWKGWAGDAGIKAGKINSLSTRLVAIGFERFHNNRARGFLRIAIKDMLNS